MRINPLRHQSQPMPALPLWWAREFSGLPRMVREARSWIEEPLPAGDPLGDLVMITSELAANAVAHTRSGRPGGRFTVDLAWSAAAVRVCVGDQGSRHVPMVAAKTAHEIGADESGRGLFLVSALSAAWGTAGDADAHWVWADVPWDRTGGVPASDAAARELAALREAHLGASAWYSDQTRTWCASLPGTTPDRLLSAPSLTALGQMLARFWPLDTSPRSAELPGAREAQPG
jgi:serine/threonine-protein kinase RsbW